MRAVSSRHSFRIESRLNPLNVLAQSDREQRILKVAQHQCKRLQTCAEIAEESDRCALAKILPLSCCWCSCSICFRVLACAECVAVAVWFWVVAPSFSGTKFRAKGFRFFAHVGWRSVCSISLPTKSAGSTCRKCDCCKSQPVQSEVNSSNFGRILYLAWSSNARQILKHQKPPGNSPSEVDFLSKHSQ